MSGWNFRVWRILREHEEKFVVYETYYNDQGEPNSYGILDIYDEADSLEELRQKMLSDLATAGETCTREMFSFGDREQLEEMLKACDKEVLFDDVRGS